MKTRPKRPRDIEKLPRHFYICLCVFAVALAIYVAAAFHAGFAAFFNRTVGAAFRAAFAYLTCLIPFSLAELLLYCLPFGVVAVAVFAYRYRCDTWKSTFVFLGSLLSLASLLFSLFVFTFATGYHTAPLDERMELSSGEVGKEDLYRTASILAAALNNEVEKIEFSPDGFSKMPYGREEMNRKLIAAYDPVCDAYPFIDRFYSRVKPVLMSRAMSYTHITGVYTFFTGEANINVAFPDYTIPYTAAHELAHQRGVAREEEANFVAFLATVASEDPYLRYSGYLNLFEYVAGALSRTDAALCRAVVATLDERVKGELVAYEAFFEKYQNSAASKVSDAVNDTFLKLHGNSAGTASYGLVVRLAVAYYQ